MGMPKTRGYPNHCDSGISDYSSPRIFIARPAKYACSASYLIGHKAAPKTNYRDEKNLVSKDYTISLCRTKHQEDRTTTGRNKRRNQSSERKQNGRPERKRFVSVLSLRYDLTRIELFLAVFVVSFTLEIIRLSTWFRCGSEGSEMSPQCSPGGQLRTQKIRSSVSFLSKSNKNSTV